MRTVDDVPAGRDAGSSQHGSGLFGTLMGFTVFMLLLMAAVQVMYNLYATTVVTGAAFDAARHVAGYDHADDRCGTTAEAESALRSRLGRYLDRGAITIAWTCDDPEIVRLAFEADHPSILPEALRNLGGLGRPRRVVEVRSEDLR